MTPPANDASHNAAKAPGDAGYPCPPSGRFPRTLINRLEKSDLPLSALGAVRELRDYLAAVERESIVKARTFGASPSEIARELGVTRQTVYKKLDALLKLNEPTIVVPDELSEPTIVLPDAEVDRTD